MHVRDDDRRARGVRSLGLVIAAVGIVVAVSWSLVDAGSPQSYGSRIAFERVDASRSTTPTVSAITSPTLSVGAPIKELPAPAALEIRNEVEGVAEIRVVGASPMPIFVARSDKPKVRTVASGQVTIDVFDPVSGEALLREAVLRLLPDEMSAMVVRRDATGAVVLLVALLVAP